MIGNINNATENIYSASEVKIGKWMDKDLFRIMVDCGTMPNTTTKYVQTSLPSTVKVKRLYGYFEDNNSCLMIPHEGQDGYQVACWYNYYNSQIGIQAMSDRSAYTGVMFIEYTKS